MMTPTAPAPEPSRCERPDCKSKARELRETRKYLRDLVAAVASYLDALDREMLGPSTVERGRRIAALCNRLEMSKDIAERFGLGVRPKRRHKRGSS